jgi:serine/threonine protein kinase
MSVANWTTRFLVDTVRESEMQSDGPSGGSGGDEPQGRPVRAPKMSIIGSRVGAYEVTKRLGAGGVGEVFKGVDTMLRREVAIKVLRDELAADPIFLQRFRQEAQLHAKLSHPNVASVHAFLHEGGKEFMVMEYVAGISLDEFIRSGGPVPVERALTIFRSALEGIAHAHDNGIVHRDIKPANIMLADSGEVKVMDFGIARALDSKEHLTRIGQVAGTARAMSPEQIRGRQADVRSDIYSLGIVLYTLLAGRPPFEGNSDLALMKSQLDEMPPPLHTRVAGVPPSVEAAVMRALEKDPGARFQTVGAFSQALAACQAERNVEPPPSRFRFDEQEARTVINPMVHPQTSSRTVLNPTLHTADESPKTIVNAEFKPLPRVPTSAASAPLGRPESPRPTPAKARTGRRVAVVAAAVLALGGAALVAWRLTLGEAPPAAPAGAIAELPVAAPAAPKVAALAPAAAAAERAATPAPPAPPAPVTQLATAPAAAPPANTETIRPRTLSIGRLPSGEPGSAVPPSSADATSVGADAGGRFKPGERVRLLVTPNQDAHVYCYLQDESQRITRFFPNRFTKSALVTAAAPLEIPGPMRFELVANARRVTETIACFASDHDVLAELPKSVVGTDFAKLPATSLQQIRSAFERAAGATLGQARFRVEPE